MYLKDSHQKKKKKIPQPVLLRSLNFYQEGCLWIIVWLLSAFPSFALSLVKAKREISSRELILNTVKEYYAFVLPETGLYTTE